jgi:poly(3-hydroxybutyrate) depolymerase
VPYYHLYDLDPPPLPEQPERADGAPLSPRTHTPVARSIAADCDLFERTARRFDKPSFDITSTVRSGTRVPIGELTLGARPFSALRHFAGPMPGYDGRPYPKVLLVAPLAGHYPTLLRDTVEALLPCHDVYLSEWEDARYVPAVAGAFDLDDCIDDVIAMIDLVGVGANVVAVGRAVVPTLAAVALIEAHGEPGPATLTLIGGPVDAGAGEGRVHQLARTKGIDWFARNVVMKVPFTYPGAFRDVYPGFLNLTGFLSFGLERRLDAHKATFIEFVRGDADTPDRHRLFFDEFLSVMDLTAEFFLGSVDAIFIERLLPRQGLRHRGEPVEPARIRRTALMTVEGEFDLVAGGGQTHAAQMLCRNLAEDGRAVYTQPGVGHFGLFNGCRFRAEVAPRLADFIASRRSVH